MHLNKTPMALQKGYPTMPKYAHNVNSYLNEHPQCIFCKLTPTQTQMTDSLRQSNYRASIYTYKDRVCLPNVGSILMI